MIQKLTRFDHDTPYGVGAMKSSEEGQWVRWEDVEALQKEQKNILSALLRSSIKVTQALIEEMAG